MKRHLYRPSKVFDRYAQITTCANRSKLQPNELIQPILHLSLPNSEQLENVERQNLDQIVHTLNFGFHQNNGNWVFELTHPYSSYNLSDESFKEITTKIETVWECLKQHQIAIEDVFFALGNKELGNYKDNVLFWFYFWELEQENSPIPILKTLTPEWSPTLLRQETDKVCLAIFGKTLLDLYPPLENALPSVFQQYFHLLSGTTQDVDLIDLFWAIKGDIDQIDSSQ